MNDDKSLENLYSNIAYTQCPQYIPIAIYQIQVFLGPETQAKEKDATFSILGRDLANKLKKELGPVFFSIQPANNEIWIAPKRSITDFPASVPNLEANGKKANSTFSRKLKLQPQEHPQIFLDLFRQMFKDYCENNREYMVRANSIHLDSSNEISLEYGQFKLPITGYGIVDFTLELTKDFQYILISFDPRRRYQCTVYDFWKKSILGRCEKGKDIEQLEEELLEGEWKGRVHGLGVFIPGNVLAVSKEHPKDFKLSDGFSLQNYWERRYKKQIPLDDFIVTIEVEKGNLTYPASQLGISLKFLSEKSSKGQEGSKIEGYPLSEKVEIVKTLLKSLFSEPLNFHGWRYSFNNELVSVQELLDKKIAVNFEELPKPSLSFGLTEKGEHGLQKNPFQGLHSFGPYSGSQKLLVIPVISNLVEANLKLFEEDLKQTFSYELKLGQIKFHEPLIFPAKFFNYQNRYIDLRDKLLLRLNELEGLSEGLPIVILISLPPNTDFTAKARLLEVIGAITDQISGVDFSHVQFINESSLKKWEEKIENKNGNIRYQETKQQRHIDKRNQASLQQKSEKRKKSILQSIALQLYFKVDLRQFRAPWVLEPGTDIRKHTLYGGFDVTRQYEKQFDSSIKKFRYVQKAEHSIKAAICNANGMIITFEMGGSQQGETITEMTTYDILRNTHGRISDMRTLGQLDIMPDRFVLFKDGKMAGDIFQISPELRNVQQGWKRHKEDPRGFQYFIYCAVIKEHTFRIFTIQQGGKLLYGNPKGGVSLDLDLYTNDDSIATSYIITSNIGSSQKGTMMARPKKLKIYPINIQTKEDVQQIRQEFFDLCFLNWSTLSDKEGTILPLRITGEVGLYAKEGIKIGINQSLKFLPL